MRNDAMDFLEMEPTLAHVNDKNGHSPFYYFRWSNDAADQNIEVFRTLLDYSKECDALDFVDSCKDEEEHRPGFVQWAIRIIQARYLCKMAAHIIRTRRVVSRNKDTSWLLSRFILATRNDQRWMI